MAILKLNFSYLKLTAGLLLLSSAGLAQLRITTTTVPVATQYQSYSTALTATGGTLPYHWSVVSSTFVSLPEGMSLNPTTGVVSATQVNGQGGYTVTIQVTDSGSPAPATATANLNFGVNSDGNLGGCQMFPADSIYNQRVDQLPVDTVASHQIPSIYLNSPIHPDFGHGFYPAPGGIPYLRVPANQPLINVNLSADGQIDANGTYSWPFPAWPNAVIEGTSFGRQDEDHHILILKSSVNNINGPQTGPCILYETYQSNSVPSMWNANTNTWLMLAGIHYVMNSNEIAASTATLDNGAQDSPGIPMVPLLIRYSEVPLGVNHPLRISFPSPTNSWVWPGTGCCGGSGPPQGLLYRLKASVNVQSVCPVASFPQAATVLQALQQYGAYMSDHGSPAFVGGAPDVRWDDDDLACIKKLHASDLEVVDNSALEVSSISGQTKPYVVPATLPAAAVNTAYIVTLSAAGGNPTSRRWTVSSGALPAGFLLNANTGAISGTATTSTGSPFSFTVAVTDTVSGFASQARSFSIAVTGTGDTTPPSIPTGVSAAAFSSSQINVAWAASTDNVGVTGYRVFRNGTQVGTPATLSFSDTGLTAATTYSYTVAAVDAAGNTSTPSTASSAMTLAAADTTPPTVSITTPTATTVSGTITVTATAADNVGVADVQFQLDGVNVGADLTAAPYSISWNTTTASNGTHNLTAIARDAAHNSKTSSIVQVTVSNAAGTVPTAGMIGYWNFDEGSGTVAHDTSGGGFTGTVNGATWATGKINSGLSFNGTTSYVATPNILLTTFSVSTWVNSAVTTQAGYTRIVESQYSSGFYLGVNSTGTKYKFIVNSATGSTGGCGLAFGCAEGGPLTTGWHLVTGTFDGSSAKLYVDNTLVASDTFTTPTNANFPLYIGRYFAGGGFNWNGGIDEVRLYNRALTSAEVSSIFAFTGGAADTTPPSIPAGVSAIAASSSQINVSWSASTDNVGVTGYRVFRNGTQVGTPATLSFLDSGLTASTSYSYTVAAVDAAGNVSTPSTAASATTLAGADTTPPTVSITAPTAGATVSATINLTATAADNVGVADVQFQLDGVNVGADLTSAPYAISWNTTAATNGTHTLTAIARDAAHNATTSTAIQVTVNNSGGSVPTVGLIGYWNFDEGTGAVAHDTSGSGFTGTVIAGTWATGKINSGLSLNGTTSYVITPSIPLTTFSISTWVNSAVTTQNGYTRIVESQYSSGFYLGTNSAGTKYKFIINSATGSTGSCGLPFGCAEGGAITTGWHLVTGTFDGSSAKLYVDNVLVASDTFTTPLNANFPLYIGRNFGGSGFNWNGGLDEVRLYNRALTSAEVSSIFAFTGGSGDTTPPSIPTGVAASAVSSTQINVSWTASTDNFGVTGYRVFRNGTQVGTPATLSFSDTGLAASTSYSYTVAAVDAAGNASTPSTASSAMTLAGADTTSPTVSITTPLANATVSATINLIATAADNVAVADVQFQLDGLNLGADLTTAPYSISWDTTTASNGIHSLTAIARDAAHNAKTSTVVSVTVSNAGGTVPTTGLIGYWNFDEGAGTLAHDTSGNGFNGTAVNTAWATGKTNSGLSFNGTSSYVVTPSIPLNTFSISTWVNSAATTQTSYARVVESQYSSGFYLGVNSTGTKYKFIVNSATGSTGSCGLPFGCAEGGAITTGWHLVTGTFDGTTAKLYVDNVLVASDTFTTPLNANFPLYIARYFAGGGFNWNGGIDEVRLYNRALTLAEVGAIFSH